MDQFLEICERATRAGGSVLQRMYGQVSAHEKGPRDLVTEADLASQNTVSEIVKREFPDHNVLGEEDDPADIRRLVDASEDRDQFCWVIDPLDGTTNFVHGLPIFAVSVALLRGTELVAGCVYNPATSECFAASRGGGATLNGEPIQTTGCSSLSQALVSASFAANVPRGSSEVGRFIEVLHRCRAMRRLGSAALNLCYVAAGRLDAYWATSVKAWDIAAGVLILSEAGGVVRQLGGSPLELWHPKVIATATPALQRELQEAVSKEG